jgi:hypothetical protein
MSTAELKENIISKIANIEDLHLLEDILKIIGLQTNSNVFELDDSQKLAIKEGRIEIECGKFLTNEQVDKDIDQWLER